MSDQPIRVTVWGENVHEHTDEAVRSLYPDGLHGAIAAGIGDHLGAGAIVRTATLQEHDHGLGGNVLAETDVLTWWGHQAHGAVADEIVDRIQERVLMGMGLLVLHSAHLSKIFRRLMGTTCNLHWREAGDREVVWRVNPGHAIAEGIPEAFVIPHQEMYGEYFDIPQPDELVFLSSFSGGEVFRSGCCFTRGSGRVFYFSPGHETFPVYHQPEVRRIIANAVRWAYADGRGRETPYVSMQSPTSWFEDH